MIQTFTPKKGACSCKSQPAGYAVAGSNHTPLDPPVRRELHLLVGRGGLGGILVRVTGREGERGGEGQNT